MSRTYRTRRATDQYGHRVVIFRQLGTTCYTDRGIYHCTKLYIGGQPVAEA